MSSVEGLEKLRAYTRHRRNDPDTSRDAARIMVDFSDITAIQAAVLAEIRKAGAAGLTDLELENNLGNRHGSTLRTRRSELVQKGLVRDKGERRILNGRNRIIWVAAEVPKVQKQSDLFGE